MNPKILAVIFSLKLARLVGFEGILGPKSTTPTPTFNLPGLNRADFRLKLTARI
jgi:hypothetical protein